ncbi:hypothetical protein LTS10_007504 [Elasticomyces elasticus]|nr:hypothetical protein LTS10_007504 [Elasticomyces elasticus]
MPPKRKSERDYTGPTEATFKENAERQARQDKKDLDEYEAVLPGEEEEPNISDSDFESENEMPADTYEYWDEDGNLVEYKGKMRTDKVNRKHEAAVRASPDFEALRRRSGERFLIIMKEAKADYLTQDWSESVLMCNDRALTDDRTRQEFVPCNNGIYQAIKSNSMRFKLAEEHETLPQDNDCECRVCTSRSIAAQTPREVVISPRRSRRRAQVKSYGVRADRAVPEDPSKAGE